VQSPDILPLLTEKGLVTQRFYPGGLSPDKMRFWGRKEQKASQFSGLEDRHTVRETTFWLQQVN
jgi:hypothetical protein